MATCAIYIDGGYLNKILQRDHGSARIDMAKLVHKAAGPDELLRAYYYHCMPYQSDPPTPDEQKRFGAKHRFITALNRIPRFQVRLGKLKLEGKTADGKPIFVQKRVDMMLGVDMALLAIKHRVDRVVLLTGDSDTIPAVEAVKSEGVVVTLLHGPLKGLSPPSRDLYQIADEWAPVDAAMINDIRR